MASSAWLASLRDDLVFVRERFLVGFHALAHEDLGHRFVPRLMSAREQALHVVKAERFWRSRCTGEDPLGDWPAESESWGRDALLARLAAERALTMDWVAGLTESDLVQPVTDGRGRDLSVVGVINHLVRHDAHHAGQLIMIFRLRHPDDDMPSSYAKIVDHLATQTSE